MSSPADDAFGIAVIQMDSAVNAVEQNLARMISFLDEAVRRHPGAQLAVFPEMATCGYACGKRFYDYAERWGEGPCFAALARAARERGVYVAYGFPELSTYSSVVMYNSIGLVGPGGEPVGAYRKTHLFSTESRMFRPGEEYLTFATPLCRVGIVNCWDLNFPEPVRALALGGAEVVLAPANFDEEDRFKHDFTTACRAFENGVFVVMANRVGEDAGIRFIGWSRIIGPLGQVIAELPGSEEGILYGEVSLSSRREQISKTWNFLRERRPSTYGKLVESC